MGGLGCCTSVLRGLWAGWIASDCDLVYGALYTGVVVWIEGWLGCACCCFEVDCDLVWVVDGCFGVLMVVLMVIWWLCAFVVCMFAWVCLGFCLCGLWCCFVYYADGFSLVV